MDLINGITVGFLKFFFRTFYRLQVYGNKSVYKGGAIIAANHASFLDPPLLSAIWPERINFLARADLLGSSFLGWFLKKLHAYPVHGSTQDLESFRIVSQLLKEGKKVVIFPEGFRSDDGDLKPIKNGIAMLAIKANSPIIPVYIEGAFEAWPRHKRWPRLGKKLVCIIGEPIFPEAFSNLDKKEAREALTNQIQQTWKDLRDSHGKDCTI